jgi:protein SCO1/2
MADMAITAARSEEEFAARVDAYAIEPNGRERLTDLLREDHPIYGQRGAATVVRMRGWVLLALERTGVADDALLFVLEELDTGVDPYLVAAAARALRHYPQPTAAFAPFLIRAIGNIRYHDEPVSFTAYGEYAISTASTPVRELLATLAWLGPHARAVLPELRALRGSLPARLRSEVDRALDAIGSGEPAARDACCVLPHGVREVLRWAPELRRGSASVDSVLFEDQNGDTIAFRDFFRGRPCVVVFFYTRCDNPLKCSLTITRLARLQQLLEGRGLGGIRTAAITYDPGFDTPERLRRYGESRGVRLNADNRMLRAKDGLAVLRAHFRLGVNFVESLVNRHRVELFVLDAGGRIGASFERLRWDEEQVANAAAELLNEKLRQPGKGPGGRQTVSAMTAALAPVAVALIPKCPVCWAAYLSMLGVAGAARISYLPWLRLLLVLAMLINAASTWARSRATGRMNGAYLVWAGVLAMVAALVEPAWQATEMAGIVLIWAGSLWSVVASR